MEIIRGMYGLIQAGNMETNLLHNGKITMDITKSNKQNDCG